MRTALLGAGTLPFWPVVLQHHCRSCGRLMCADCTNQRWDFQGHFWGQRICSSCRYQLRVQSETAEVGVVVLVHTPRCVFTLFAVADQVEEAERKGETLTVAKAKEQLELRRARITELEEVVESVSFALEQATIQRRMLLKKVVVLTRNVETLSKLAAEHTISTTTPRHECSTDVAVQFHAGPLGLALTNSNSRYAMAIEGFTKVSAFPALLPSHRAPAAWSRVGGARVQPSENILGQAEEFNRGVGEDRCCGVLRQGMALVSINGVSTASHSYSAVETLYVSVCVSSGVCVYRSPLRAPPVRAACATLRGQWKSCSGTSSCRNYGGATTSSKPGSTYCPSKPTSHAGPCGRRRTGRERTPMTATSSSRCW